MIRVEDSEGLRRFTLRSDVCADGVRVGDSIAVNGVCLTAVNVAANEVSVEAIPETLRLTNLGQLVAKSPVNLERPLAYGNRMGGHYVQGHVDATSELVERQPDGESELVQFAVPPDLMNYIVSKGFVALDGVSLTVVDPLEATFAVALIPHTLRLGHPWRGAHRLPGKPGSRHPGQVRTRAGVRENKQPLHSPFAGGRLQAGRVTMTRDAVGDSDCLHPEPEALSPWSTMDWHSRTSIS